MKADVVDVGEQVKRTFGGVGPGSADPVGVDQRVGGEALAAADLVEALQGPGPFTVFAPNNAAFDKLPAGTLDDLLKPANKAELAAILKNHVVEGKVMAANVKAGKVETLAGEDVVVTVDNGKVKFGNALVTATDIEASNGVIHKIDTVVIED